MQRQRQRQRIAARNRLWTLLALLMAAPCAALAQAPPELNAQQVLEVARGSYARQDYVLEGSLRRGFERTPFQLVMEGGLLRFGFTQPDQEIDLQMKDDGYVLRERVDGKDALVDRGRYGEAVRGSDISYEDLAMRFLFWPAPVLEGVENIRTSPCWKLIVKNPDDFGPYRYVLLWVDQRSGGLAQIMGFDAEQRLVRKMLVTKVQQIDAVWMLKEMRVERYDTDSGAVAGRTYLEIDDPDKEAPSTFKKR